jgi:hypothetical protein
MATATVTAGHTATPVTGMGTGMGTGGAMAINGMIPVGGGMTVAGNHF